jgi:hypothetical protein
MSQHPVIRFDIRPHVGALPVTFGMHRDEVHRLLGAPQASSPLWNKSGFSEGYLSGAYNVGYDNAWAVNHLGFGPGSIELSIDGRPVWSLDEQPDPNPIFLSLDPAPVTDVGFWIFLKLGVTTTGYHDDDPSQRAITAFPPSRVDRLTRRATPADTSRYTKAAHSREVDSANA